jgi:IS30 family transposase
MTRFTVTVPEVIEPFWEAIQRGEFTNDAAALVGTHRWRGLAWLREAGGVRPRRGRN